MTAGRRHPPPTGRGAADRPASGACPACGDRAATAVLAGLAGIARHPYLRCRRCGLVRAEADPAEEERFYRLVYPDLPHRRLEPDRRLPLFRAFLDRAATTVRGRRLLDIGCGPGHFLALARSLGWEATGCDINPDLARAAAARSGTAVHPGPVESLEPSPPFDLVTLWNVLDQVTDPLGLLVAARHRLGPGGVLFARVPNGSLHLKLMAVAAGLGPAPRPLRLDRLTPCHLYLLRPADLARLLARAGLARVEIVPARLSRGGWTRPLRAALDATVRAVGRGGRGRSVVAPSLEAWARSG